MRAAGATAKDATTSAIFIPKSQRPRHVVNAWDECCWVFLTDIITLENAAELLTTATFGLTVLPRDSSIITKLKSTANKMFIVSGRC